ncbi:MAG: molybdopterin-guanine dinucleotide biosynthesis protein B [Aquificae bacterium]|nr:molybdopterin-guanine dinucleotide biosynthesis protein B [Aquificota bacterium]
MVVLQVVGPHDGGKTTLVEFLVRELKKRGYRVGYLKHDPKGKGITDKEGSDTARVKPFTERTVLLSPSQTTLWLQGSLSLKEALRFFEGLDAVLVEGFKGEEGFPKVWVDRRGNFPEGAFVFKVRGREDYEGVLNWLLERLQETSSNHKNLR